MKKIAKILAVMAVALSFSLSASAQDMAQATEMFNAAHKAYGNGDATAALEGFQKALSAAEALGEEGAALVNDCKNVIPKVYLKLGKDAFNAKDFAKALECLANAEKLATETAQEEVAADAKEVVPQVYLANGNALFNEKKYAEAAAEYQKAIDLNGENGVAWLRLGMCKSNSGDVEGAIAAFNNASEFGQKADADKQFGNLYRKVALAAIKAKNYAGALENALKANEYGNTQANHYGGMAASILKKYDECISLLEGDNTAEGKYYLASAYEAKGNKAKACELYKSIAADKKYGANATYKVNTLCK